MVARYAQRRAGGDHRGYEPHGVKDAGATVHEVAQEDRPAPLRVGPHRGVSEDRPRRIVGCLTVSELLQQGLQLVAAAMDIADDVERPVLVPPVVPERNPLDDRRLHRLGRLQHEDVAKPLPPEPPEPTPQLRLLIADDMGTKVPIAPAGVAVLADPLVQIQHDRHGQDVVLPGQFHERLAGLRLNVGGIDHRESAQGEPLPGDEPEHLEGVLRDGLVVLVVGDHPPAGIGRDHLGGSKMPAGERALSRAAGTDEDDEAQLGDLDRHALTLVKTAICVGGPSASTSGPIARNRTE